MMFFLFLMYLFSPWKRYSSGCRLVWVSTRAYPATGTAAQMMTVRN